ncbi:diguanylate cyclase [uncultured Marinobacter sp.]|uniref:sensor domain-containing diguanylate cyclase n=1 Tax=uncultured Marinobacter sp. TaxID=187379 RepID=UPI0030D92CF2
MQLDANHLPGGYILLDNTNTVTAINQPLCDWLGRSREDLCGRSPERWMTVASRMYYLGHVLPSLRLHQHAEEVFLSFTNATGDALPVIMNAAAMPSPGSGYQLLILPMQRRNLVEEQLQQARKTADRAVAEKDRALQELQTLASQLEQRQAELAALNVQLEQLATRDALTGLCNRRVYDREIDMNLALFKRTKRPFTLALADIDWFKQFNDDFGHGAGDQVLQEISLCLRQGMRDIDTLVRMGGEEFALILPDTTAQQAALVAERKRTEIEQYKSQYGSVTLSFGITEVRAGDTRAEIYGRADQSLYQAKRQGRNQVCVG